MWLIRKDGLWLLGYKPSGIKAFVEGQLTDVLTAIWGNDIRDAKPYEFEQTARAYTKLFGGEVISVSLRQ